MSIRKRHLRLYKLKHLPSTPFVTAARRITEPAHRVDDTQPSILFPMTGRVSAPLGVVCIAHLVQSAHQKAAFLSPWGFIAFRSATKRLAQCLLRRSHLEYKLVFQMLQDH